MQFSLVYIAVLKGYFYTPTSLTRYTYVYLLLYTCIYVCIYLVAFLQENAISQPAICCGHLYFLLLNEIFSFSNILNSSYIILYLGVKQCLFVNSYQKSVFFLTWSLATLIYTYTYICKFITTLLLYNMSVCIYVPSHILLLF